MNPKLLRHYSNILDEAEAAAAPKPNVQTQVNRANSASTAAAGRAIGNFFTPAAGAPAVAKPTAAGPSPQAQRNRDNLAQAFNSINPFAKKEPAGTGLAGAPPSASTTAVAKPAAGAPAGGSGKPTKPSNLKPAVVPPAAGGVGASTQAQVDAANAQRAPRGSSTTTAGEQPNVAPPPPPPPAADVKSNTPPVPPATVFGGRADAPKSPFAGPQEIIKPTASPTLKAPADPLTRRVSAINPVIKSNPVDVVGPVDVGTVDVRPGASPMSNVDAFAKQSSAKLAGGGPTVTTGSAAPPMSTPTPYAAPAGGGPIVTTNPSQPPPSMELSPKDQSTLGKLPAGPGQISSGDGTLMSRSGPVRDGSNEKFTQGGFRLPEEAELEEDDSLSELMRLSGRPMQEKAPPGAKAERQVKHVKAGYAKDGKLTDKEKSIAYATAWKSHNKSKVSESVMLEAGSALEHIIKKFKHETKNFLAGNDLDNDLYDALYDYYSDNGEIPYGVAKARDGDPIQWVSDRFADEMQMHGYGRQTDMLNMPGHDHELTELARLAGLSESQVSECGDMDSMEQHDSMSVSTNMSSDGTKSVNISAQGDRADSLLQMLKMAGMRPYDDHEHAGMTEPEVIMISSEPQHDDMHDSMMHDEMMDEEYANSPDPVIAHGNKFPSDTGNDMHRPKDSFSDKPYRGDNPMAESMLDADLEAMLESILVREEMTDVLKAEQPYKDEKTGKMVTPPKGATMPPADSPPAAKTTVKK